MRYFSRGWANGDLTEEEHERAKASYAARVAAIASRLPDSMKELEYGASLHDALIESIRWDREEKVLRMKLVGGTSELGYQTVDLTYQGAMLGRARLGSLRRAASDREACVLYDEIDIADDGALVHRILFWPNEEVTIDFAALEYKATPRMDARVCLGGAFVIDEKDEDW